MRPLLLLLLAFLLPLQLLAAPVVEPQPCPVCAQAMADGRVADSLAQAQLDLVADAATAAADGDLDEDSDVPTAQADGEDHAMPVPVATPALAWQSFPHAFATPAGGSSFLHEQLRPPPLA